MTDPTTRLALTTMIASAIWHCEAEIAEMNRAARLKAGAAAAGTRSEGDVLVRADLRFSPRLL